MKKRNKKIVKLYKGKRKYTLGEIAQKFQITKQRVYQILKQELKWKTDTKKNKLVGNFRYTYIPEKFKKEIFIKYNFRCRRCRGIKDLEINHIIPRIVGGKTTKENLELLCQKCNKAVWIELVKKALKFYFRKKLIKNKGRIKN